MLVKKRNCISLAIKKKEGWGEIKEASPLLCVRQSAIF